MKSDQALSDNLATNIGPVSMHEKSHTKYLASALLAIIAIACSGSSGQTPTQPNPEHTPPATAEECAAIPRSTAAEACASVCPPHPCPDEGAALRNGAELFAMHQCRACNQCMQQHMCACEYQCTEHTANCQVCARCSAEAQQRCANPDINPDQRIQQPH